MKECKMNYETEQYYTNLDWKRNTEYLKHEIYTNYKDNGMENL